MFRQPATGGKNLHLHPVGSVPVVFRDNPPNVVEVFCCLPGAPPKLLLLGWEFCPTVSHSGKQRIVQRIQFLLRRLPDSQRVLKHVGDCASGVSRGIAHKESPFPCGAIPKSARPKNPLKSRRIFSGRFESLPCGPSHRSRTGFRSSAVVSFGCIVPHTSFLVGNGDNFIKQSGILGTPEQSQSLLE